MSKKCKHLKGDWCEHDGYTKREKPCPKGFSDTNPVPCYGIVPPKKKLVKVKAWAWEIELKSKKHVTAVSWRNKDDIMGSYKLFPCTITYDSKYLKGGKK